MEQNFYRRISVKIGLDAAVFTRVGGWLACILGNYQFLGIPHLGMVPLKHRSRVGLNHQPFD